MCGPDFLGSPARHVPTIGTLQRVGFPVMIGRFVAFAGDPSRSPTMRHAPLSLSLSVILAAGLGGLAGCQPATLPVAEAAPADHAPKASDSRFEAVAESLLMRALQRSPE